jgi:phosphopantothenoylcysteine decarboxylase/phosphopantothenate--cysteine ligase
VKKEKTPSSRILITAGPTVEPLDPIRFISNYSTGTMGYEIAKQATERGLDVCLITGPVDLEPPRGVEVVKVRTAREMRDRVLERADDYGCVIMAAAVCDFRPYEQKKEKIKKQDRLTLELVRNPDILSELSSKKHLIRVGFALETGREWLENAREKMRAKKLDLIIANVKGEGKDPFGGGNKDFTIIDKLGNVKDLRGISKAECAKVILEETERML